MDIIRPTLVSLGLATSFATGLHHPLYEEPSDFIMHSLAGYNIADWCDKLRYSRIGKYASYAGLGLAWEAVETVGLKLLFGWEDGFKSDWASDMIAGGIGVTATELPHYKIAEGNTKKSEVVSE